MMQSPNLPAGRKRLVLAAIATAVASAGLTIAARRSGTSLRAWLLLRVVAFVAPDFSGPDALSRAIERDRARGPAYPPKHLRRRLDFADETIGDDRVFRARSNRKATSPLRLLYLHGGGYVLDLQAVQWNLIDGLIARTGAEVLVPIYPLAPDHGWEAGFEAVRRIYLKLLEECDPSRLVIVADSAGGGLALGLAQRLRDARTALPAALILFSPWLDNSVGGADQPELEQRDPALTIDFLRRAAASWAKDIPADDPRVSPLFGDQDGLPPMLVFAGTRELLVSDARRLAVRNRQVVLREYRNMIHVWPCAWFLPEARRALDEAADFIREKTAVGDRPIRPGDPAPA